MPAFDFYRTGTVDLTNGSTHIVVHGGTWSDIAQDDSFNCRGSTGYIDTVDVLGSTAELQDPWPGDTVSGASYYIRKDGNGRFDQVETQSILRDVRARLAVAVYPVDGSVPDPALGSNGNLAFKVGSASVQFWEKTDGDWGSPVITLAGGAGSVSAPLVLTGGSDTPPVNAASDYWVAQFAGPDDANASIAIDSFGTHRQSSLILRAARGAAAVLLGLLANDVIGGMKARAYTSASAYTDSTAKMLFVADEDQTASNQGTRIEFWTTPKGVTGASSIKSMVLGSDARLAIGAVSPLAISTVYDLIHLTLPNASGAGGQVIDSYGTGNTTAYSALVLRRADNTYASPTGLKSGDTIGVVRGDGYGDDAFFGGASQLVFTADGDWTNSAQPARFGLFATPAGVPVVGGRVEVLRGTGTGVSITGTLALSGMLDGSVPFFDDGELQQDNDHFVWYDGQMGVGVSKDQIWPFPDGPIFTVSKNANRLQEPHPGLPVTIHYGGKDGENFRILYDSYGTASVLEFRRFNGTALTPTALVKNQEIAGITGYGYDGSAVTDVAPVYIWFNSGNSDWTPTSTPTTIHFATTPIGATVRVPHAKLYEDGGWLFGPCDITDSTAFDSPGPYNLKTWGKAFFNTPTLASGDTSTGIFGSTDGGAVEGQTSLASGTAGGARVAATTTHTPSAAGHRLGFFAAGVNDGTLIRVAASIAAFSAETWNIGVAQGTYWDFLTTTIGAASRTAKMRLQASGGLTLGNGILSTDPGAGNLLVAGSVQAASVTSTGFVGMLAASAPTTPGVAGALLYSDTLGRFSWKRDDGFTRTIDGTLTANRIYLLPDASGTLALTSDIAAYVAAQDVEVFKGAIDCSANPNYPAADAGNIYRVSVAGKIGGASGVNVEVNDRLECFVDSTASGTQAGVGANWMITQANIDGTVVGPSSVTDGNPAVFDGTGGHLIKQVTFSAFKASLSLDNVDNTSDSTKNAAAVTLTNKTLTSPVIANIAPGANFTITQNSVAALTSVNAGAIVNTLYLNAGKVGIGTTAPGAPLVVSLNSAALPTVMSGTVLQVGQADAVSTRVLIEGFAGSTSYTFRRANTTAAAPSALAANDLIGLLSWVGYGATGYASGARASIVGAADESWSDTAQGTRITFSTTTNTTATAVERMRIDNAGNVIVGTAAIATSATDGFLYIPTCAGTPTGTATAETGRIAMVYDTTNHQFWFYDGGGWKQPKTPAGAATVTWQ